MAFPKNSRCIVPRVYSTSWRLWLCEKIHCIYTKCYTSQCFVNFIPWAGSKIQFYLPKTSTRKRNFVPGERREEWKIEKEETENTAALRKKGKTRAASFILSSCNPLVKVLNVLRQRNESRGNVSPAEWSTSSIPTRWDSLQRRGEIGGGLEREN